MFRRDGMPVGERIARFWNGNAQAYEDYLKECMSNSATHGFTEPWPNYWSNRMAECRRWRQGHTA